MSTEVLVYVWWMWTLLNTIKTVGFLVTALGTCSTNTNPDGTCTSQTKFNILPHNFDVLILLAMSYSPLLPQLFPALPSSGEGLGMAQNATQTSGAPVAASGGWGAAARNNDAMRIQTSVITQVRPTPQAGWKAPLCAFIICCIKSKTITV